MKAIKALVMFLAVLLIAGLGLLGYGLYAKSGQLARGSGAATATAGVFAPAAVAEFGSVSVPVPAGARVEQSLVVGNRLVLRLIGGGPERILVLDPASGTLAGSFVLTPEPPAR